MAATGTQLVDQKQNIGPVGAYFTWGDCSRCFSQSIWSGLPKKFGPAFANPGEAPQIPTQNPKISVIMANHLVSSGNSAQVP